MDILVYTFRTFPYLEDLEKVFPDVVVLGKLKNDLIGLFELIVDKKPKLILGIALSKGSTSFFEPWAINKFHKGGCVVKSGPDELSLYVPDLAGSDFKISPQPSDSFCNYSMYKIKDFLDKGKIDIPLAFSHIEKNISINRLSYWADKFKTVKSQTEK